VTHLPLLEAILERMALFLYPSVAGNSKAAVLRITCAIMNDSPQAPMKPSTTTQ
jgi:hypothetical protein